MLPSVCQKITNVEPSVILQCNFHFLRHLRTFHRLIRNIQNFYQNLPMASVNHSCPISSQIESLNDSITSMTLRIRSLEDLLDNPNLPEDKRNQVETELIEIKKLFDTNKELLSTLHKENRKSYMVSACLIFLCFFVFGVYRLLSNDR